MFSFWVKDNYNDNDEFVLTRYKTTNKTAVVYTKLKLNVSQNSAEESQQNWGYSIDLNSKWDWLHQKFFKTV